jgi:hypothetical protein
MKTKKSSKKKKLKNNVNAEKWDNRLYIQIFQLARSGLSDEKIAEAIGYSLIQFRRRKRKDPALKDAIQQGRNADVPASDQFKDYVYSKLPEELRWVWDEIMSFQETDNAIAKMEELMRDKGKRVKQRLFLYALYHFHFNYEKAMRMLDVSKKELERWTLEPEFSELLQEIEWHTSQYFGNKAMAMARKGHPAMVKFCAQSLDPRFRKRPSEKNVNVSVSGQIGHAHVQVNKIMEHLPLEQRKLLLDRIREEKKEDIEDAEII